MNLDGTEFDMCGRQICVTSKVLEEQVRQLLHPQ
jgi:hypothetical protein